MRNELRPVDILELQGEMVNKVNTEDIPDINPVNSHLAILCTAAAMNDIGWKSVGDMPEDRKLVAINQSDDSEFTHIFAMIEETITTSIPLTESSFLTGSISVGEPFFWPSTIISQGINSSLGAPGQGGLGDQVITRSSISIANTKPGEYKWPEHEFGIFAQHSGRRDTEAEIYIVNRTPFPRAFRGFTDSLTDPVTGDMLATPSEHFAFLETLGVPSETITQAMANYIECIPYAT